MNIWEMEGLCVILISNSYGRIMQNICKYIKIIIYLKQILILSTDTPNYNILQFYEFLCNWEILDFNKSAFQFGGDSMITSSNQY